MTRFQYSRAVVVSIVFLGASLTAAQEPVIYTDNRATSSTFRIRGTSVIRAFALLNGITVPDSPDLAVNGMFGLKLDGPGWSELAGVDDEPICG